MKEKTKKIIIAIELVVLIVLSTFVVSIYINKSSSQTFIASTLNEDEKSHIFASDTDEGDGKENEKVTEEENIPPKAYAHAFPNLGTPPLTVYFQGSGEDDDGSIVSYQWRGCVWSNSQNALRTFYSPGTYYATFTIIDNDGSTDTTTVCVTVYNLRTAIKETIKEMLFGS